MQEINEGIFKAYDIRGIYPQEIDEKAVEAIGESFGHFIGKGKSIVVGSDVRLSSPALKSSLLGGLSKTGVKLFDIGVAPTPVVQFAVIRLKMDGGVAVTASHNPAEWNGLKLYAKNGVDIAAGSGLEEIRDLIKKGGISADGHTEKGSVEDISEKVMDAYEKALLGKARPAESMRIGVDPGNGCYSKLAKRILEKAGIHVMAINDFPDGSFPSRIPEPNEKSITGLRSLVIGQKLDFGVAFDADGDRALFVDDKGNVLRGDYVFALFVRNYLKKGERVVYEVSCSAVVEEEVRAKGGIPLMTRVGRTFIREEMEKGGALFGGERSGHLFFYEMDYADDVLFATFKMAELLSFRNKRLSELVDELPKYYGRAFDLEVDEQLKFKITEILKEKFARGSSKVVTIDGIKVINDRGWFVFRASNTGPMIRLVAESSSDIDLEGIVSYAKRNFEEAKHKAASS